MKSSKTMMNRGYSFIEMLIVLAILAIMSAMALVTWNSVSKARYQKAVSSFESELDTLRIQTMAQDKNMAFKIYYQSDYEDRFGNEIGAYIIKRGYVDDAGIFQEVDKTHTDPALVSDYYDYRGVSDPVFLMKEGTITYALSGAGTAIDENGVIVQYKKSDGSVLQGSGTFGFVTKKGDIVADVNLVRVTGKYYETY